ncbi:MAG: trypsin-like serine protease [Aeromonas sp.]
MNKTLLASALLLALSPAYAVTNGVSFDEPAFVSISDKCSGTVLAGNWVLSAAHCPLDSGSLVRNEGGQTATVVERVVHSYSYGGNTFDMMLLKLDRAMPSVYLVNTVAPAVDSSQMLAGFSNEHGGDLQRTSAKAMEMAFDFEEDAVFKLTTDTGHSTPGDSGGPCYNEQGIWGTVISKGNCSAIFAAKTKTWLLESINSWSYPAEVKGEGSVTIKVQSLHQNPEGDVFTPTALNGLEIESNSCEINSVVPPFGICDVVVKGSGQLSLGGDNLIEVNKPVVVPPQPEENGGNGGGDSGGGAAGWLALLGLGALVVRRRPH